MGGVGSGGSNRKSVEEHKRRGTYQPVRHKGRIGDVVELPIGPAPPAPKHLGDAGKDLWAWCWQHVSGLTSADQHNVVRACEARDMEQAAYTDWLQSGIGPRGAVVR